METALKYVQLRPHVPDPQSDLFPLFVFCASGLTHQTLAAAFARTHAPLSAGYCAPRADGTWRTFGDSTSLCLAPLAADAIEITAMLGATHMTAPHFRSSEHRVASSEHIQTTPTAASPL